MIGRCRRLPAGAARRFSISSSFVSLPPSPSLSLLRHRVLGCPAVGTTRQFNIHIRRSSSTFSSSIISPLPDDDDDNDDGGDNADGHKDQMISRKDPSFSFRKIVGGPDLSFEKGKVAYLADSSVLGSAGQTVALATVAVAPLDEQDHPLQQLRPMTVSNGQDGYNDDSSHTVVRQILRQKCRQESSSQIVPLTVDYRQRHHAVGRIPSTAARTDNRRPSVEETLASRAIDRALRPLLKPTTTTSMDDTKMDKIHLSCSIQACPIRMEEKDGVGSKGGHPVALALNSASVALGDRLVEPVAAIFLCLLEDGTVLLNPSSSAIRQDQGGTMTGYGELLYAGTRESVVMMEFSGMMEDDHLVSLLELAHSSIQCILDTLVENRENGRDKKEVVDDDVLRAQLGLVETKTEPLAIDKVAQEDERESYESKGDRIYDEALSFCQERLGKAALRLFGCTLDDLDGNEGASKQNDHVAFHNEATDGPLLGKSIRGRREHLFREEIKNQLRSFTPPEPSLANDYEQVVINGGEAIIGALAEAIHSQMLKRAVQEASMRYKRRADGRGGSSSNGSKTIRPLSIDVPALPDVVHGSALFARGETQVMVTTTLGSPMDSMPVKDPFQSTSTTLSGEEKTDGPYHDLPVGSLRYLKHQVYMESDLNSRKILADREQTGDSGTLRERRRAFLQYDFPAFSKGEVQSGPANASRREVGHGALAEKSILPILPPAHSFPYAIRITSEVTSSNGSSSMASVCGATLSLLDAGVPITDPAAGVSVGVVVNEDDGTHELLLDLTGTEDHYGAMDFKIAGTSSSVTGFQLDVKKPLPLSVIVDALSLAREGRNAILQEMEVKSRDSSEGIIADLRPRAELKPSAPRVEVVRFDPARKKDLLGPGGVVIRQMETRFDVSMDLTQEGQCLLFGDNQEMVRQAKAAVMDLVSDVEVGLTYEGTVIEMKDFGIIVELLRNKEGLCHVSELAGRDDIRKHPAGAFGLVNELVELGQKMEVVVTAVDPVQGTIRLRPATKKETL